MPASLEQFLEDYPLRTRWLDDVINTLLEKGRGTATVHALVRELWADHDINSIEQTITRRINDYCSDARDFSRPKEHDLFQRVAPATYRLRSFPSKPDTLEIVKIEFDEAAMQSMWKIFSETYGKHASWEQASNRKRLSAFAAAMSVEKWRSLYNSYKEAAAAPVDLSDLGL